MYVENITQLVMTLPLGGVESTPVVGQIPIFGNTVLGIWLDAGTNLTTHVKITDNESSLVPVTGYLQLPANNTVHLDLERKIEGPPWVLEVWGYNTGAAAATLIVYVKSGDIREVDTQTKMLDQLERITELLERSILGVIHKEVED